MKSKIGLVLFCPALALLLSCANPVGSLIVTINPDSVLNDVSHHPVGINVNYFMDGNRFPDASQSVAGVLKEMGVKYLRYPGGDKSDMTLFSVPPYEKSIPTLARTGKGAADYPRILKNYREYKYDVLDFDEFIALCREVDAEPVVVVPADGYLANYGPGDTWTKREDLIKHAVEWVRYSNVKKKYNVHYWMIGNECWHPNNVNSTAKIYAIDVVDFSKAMKAVDPSIAIIPNGNSVEFFSEVIRTAGDYIDYLCLSNYPVFNYFGGYATYRDTAQNLMGPVDRAMTAIRQSATPEQQKKFKLIVSEYGPFDWAEKWPHINDMGHNLANFEMTGLQLCSPDVLFSCFWNTRWINNDSTDNSVFDAIDKDNQLNANGLGLMIWGKFLGEKMVFSTSAQLVRTFASYSPDKKKLTLFLINKSDKPALIKPEIQGFEKNKIISSWELTGNGADDLNPVWQQIVNSTPDKLTVSGTSIQVVEFTPGN
jgi:alpha-N-arabinofuranosidase